jgi:hypothetical protein
MLPTLAFVLMFAQQVPQTQQTPTSRIELSVQPSSSEPARTTVADVIRDLAWPIAALVGLVVLRKPLSEFVSALGGRATKFSAVGVELELSVARQPRRETASFLEQVRDPTRSMVQDSSSAIQEQIAVREPVDFIVVDLEDGHAWLTSRLYILAEMMPRMRGVKAIAFVNSAPSGPQRFVGVASASQVRWAPSPRRTHGLSWHCTSRFSRRSQEILR